MTNVITAMKRPTKLPPPPPLPPPPLPPTQPPRCRSPARSCYSLHVPRQYCNGGGSECGAESVCSMPIVTTFSPQPLIRSPSSTNHSCRSESARSVCCRSCCHATHSSNYSSSYCWETSSTYSTCSQPIHHGSAHRIINGVATPISYTTSNNSFNGSGSNNNINIINNNNNSNINNNNNNNNNNNTHNNNNVNNHINNISSQNNETKPVPKGRIQRPRLCISPMPSLKSDMNNGAIQETRSHIKCRSLSYRRHIEQHVERIFKYLENREERRRKREAEIQTENHKIADTLLAVVASRESKYLRSLRIRLSASDFEEICKLGSGFIGNVCLVRKKIQDEKSGRPSLFAMKKLRKSQVFQQDHMAHVMAERDILAEADNDWIVKLYYSFQDVHYLYFILEYIPGGDMMNLLSMKNVFPEYWAKFYISEISLAVQFVHNIGFIHRDIKPDNILIDARGHIKLTDFGLCTGFRWTHDSNYYRDDTVNLMPVHSNVADEPLSGQEYSTITNALAEREIVHSRRKRALSLVGSPNYIAPEVLRQAFNIQERTNQLLCDWWSVGVILYEMVIGYCPFIDLEKLRTNQYSPSNDPPEKIQQRILNWKDHLAFPTEGDPNSPPLMQEVILGDPRDYLSGHNPEPVYAQPKYIEAATQDLIKGLLCDPQNRLCQNGIQDIMNHPFFDDIDWDSIRSGPTPYVPYLRHAEDTSHFQLDQFSSHHNDSENFLSTGTITNPVNDFTYKIF